MKILAFILFFTGCLSSTAKGNPLFSDKNSRDYDSYLKTNQTLLNDNQESKVQRNMDLNYEKTLKSPYYGLMFSSLRYQNRLTLDGSILFSENYDSQAGGIFMSHRNGANTFGAGINIESRNFLGTKKEDKSLKLNYQRKFNRYYLYELELGFSPDPTFLPSYSIENKIYFPLALDFSGFLGIKNTFYKNQSESITNLRGGLEYYYKQSIFHANSFITLHPNKTLFSWQLAHTYYFNYDSLIKYSYTFGESLDDYILMGPSKNINIKYTHLFKRLSPSIFINHYESDFRKEQQIGVSIEWKF